jgi:hypothetical protein
VGDFTISATRHTAVLFAAIFVDHLADLVRQTN